MKKRMRTVFLCALLLFVCTVSSANSALPDSISVFGEDNIGVAVSERLDTPILSTTVNGDSAVVRLLGVLPVKNVSLNVVNTQSLCPGGMAFGVKFFTEGVLVVGITGVSGFGITVSPAEEAGIKKGDVIVSVNGTKPESADDLKAMINESRMNAVSIELERDGKRISTTLYPALSAEHNEYRAGLWVRDSTAGIGTVTYVNAADGSFAGLGHGICDSDTGAIMPLGRAVVVDVDINGIKRGKVGSPGELRGAFDKVQRGVIKQNTETGVYGSFDTVPQGLAAPLPIGYKEELKTGKAFIYTTLHGQTPEKFEIEIEKLYRDSGSTKNFLIKVTDSRLLDETGGIVQGMSGSPIIQNGKLVGAVTHVLINDPTRGYGIFIENMLQASEKDAQRRPAIKQVAERCLPLRASDVGFA